MSDYIRGFALPMAVAVGVSSASGCYPAVSAGSDIDVVAGGTCDPDLAVELGVITGGAQPTIRQRAVGASQWQYWTEPTLFHGGAGQLTDGLPAWGVVRGSGQVSGRSVWVHDTDTGVRVVELVAGTVTEKAVVQLAAASLGASVSPVLLLRDDGSARIWYVLGGRVQSISSADLVTWTQRETLWASDDVLELEGHVTEAGGILMARAAGGWQQMASDDGGETWVRVGGLVTAGHVAVTRHVSGVWLVAVRSATTPYPVTVRVLGDVFQPVLCGVGVAVPYTAQSQPVVMVADPAGDVWLSQTDGYLYVTTDVGVSWQRRMASSGVDVRAGVWAGPGVVWALQDRDATSETELSWSEAGGWRGAAQWRDVEGQPVGSVRHHVPVGVAWPAQSGTAGAGSLVLSAWQHWQLNGGAGLGSSYIGEWYAGSVELDIDIDQTGSDYVELLVSTEVEAQGEYAIVIVRLSNTGASVRTAAGGVLGALSFDGTRRGVVQVAVSYEVGDDARVAVQWVPALDSALAVVTVVTVPWSGTGHSDVASGDGWILRTVQASAGVQTVYVYRAATGATVALEATSGGRQVTRWAAPVLDGITLHSERGMAAAGDTWGLGAAFTFGSDALEAASARKYWLGLGDDEQVYFDVDASQEVGGPMALYVEGEVEQVTLSAGGDDLAVVDMSAGHAALGFQAVGQVLQGVTGTARRLERNELVGGWAVWVGGKGRIISHTGGVWSDGVRVVVQGDLPPGTGTVTLYAPRALLVWQQDSVATASLTLACVGVDGEPVLLRHARVCRFVQLHRQWQRGEQLTSVALADVNYDGAGHGSVAGTDRYREVRIDWQSDPVPVGSSAESDAAGGTLADVMGVLREHGGAPLLLVRQVELDTTSTALAAAIWGRVTSPLILTLVSDDEGDELAGGWWRADAVTVREEL